MSIVIVLIQYTQKKKLYIHKITDFKNYCNFSLIGIINLIIFELNTSAKTRIEYDL